LTAATRKNDARRPPSGRRHRFAPGVPPLLRDRTFRRFWSGQAIPLFGDQISALALPLVAVLTLRATPAQVGLLSALVWVPSLLFALHAGAWADRRGQRRATMIAADLGRAALLGSIPVCAALGVLTIWQMYAIAFCAGVFSVLFWVCQPALFVAVVPADQYVAGGSLTNGSRAMSYVGGPGVAGLLVEVLTAPYAVAADALSFLGSAFFLSRIRPAEPPADKGGKGSVLAGARYIRDSVVVRSSLIAIATVNFFNYAFAALFVLYAIRSLHVRPGLLGLVLSAGAVGGVLGAVVTSRLDAWLGAGKVYTLGCLLFTAPLILVPLAGGSQPVILALLFAAEFGAGFGVMTLDISIGAIFAAVIPDQMRSRVSGAFAMVNDGIRAIGALAGGFAGSQIGLRPTLWIATVGGLAGFFLLLPGPLPRFRLPATQDETPAAADST
jgi:MFS family permease